MNSRRGRCAAALAVCAAAIGLLAVLGLTLGEGDGASDSGSSVVLFTALAGAYFATRNDRCCGCWLFRRRGKRARSGGGATAASDDRNIYRSAQ